MVVASAKTRTATLLTLAAVSILCAALLIQGTFNYKWPPDVNPLRPIVALLALGSLVSALVASRTATSMRPRVLSLILCVLASVCYLSALHGWSVYELNDPLLGLLTFGAVLGIGGWFCRQRLLATCCLIGLALLIGSAMLPGRKTITLEEQGMRGSISVVAESPDRNQGLMFTLTSVNGTPLEKRADIRYAEVSLSAGSWLPLHKPFSFHTNPKWMTEQPPAVNLLKGSSRFYNLDWARNVTATVHVQMWPPSPLLQVKIPLGQPMKTPIRTENGKASLSIAGFRDSKSSGLPPQPCLSIAVDYANTGRNGYASSDFRVQDDQGKDLDANTSQFVGIPGNHTWFDVIGVRQGAKFLTFTMYSPEQLRENTLDFKFAGLATP